VKNFALALVAAAGIAAPAFAQTTPTAATFEFRLVPQGAASSLVNGGNVTSPTVTFFVQGRAQTAANTTNYGVHRWASRANGDTATISSTNGTLVRAVSSGSTAFGRFRGGTVGNFTALRPTVTPDNSNTPTGNVSTGDNRTVNGLWSATSISSIDAWRGNSYASTAPDPNDPDGDPVALPVPFPVVTDGSFSAWANLYSFTVTASSFGTVTLNATGSLNLAVRFSNSTGPWVPDLLPNVTPVNTAFSFNYIPTPGAAALLGLGGLMAARRRR
jgi:hypothetical protein